MKIRPTWHFDGTFTLKVGGLHHTDYEFTTSMSKEEVGALIAELEVTLRESEENLPMAKHYHPDEIEYVVLDDNHAV